MFVCNFCGLEKTDEVGGLEVTDEVGEKERSPLHMKSFFDYQFVKATDKKSVHDVEFTQ